MEFHGLLCVSQIAVQGPGFLSCEKPQAVRHSSQSLPSQIDSAACALHDPCYVIATVWECTHHLSCKHITEVCIGLRPTFELLVELLHQFDEFSCVYVRISRALHVLYDLGRQPDW